MIRVRRCVFAAVIVLTFIGASCRQQPVDLARDLELVDVDTGWFDAGIVDEKNKLVPSVYFRIRNRSSQSVASVQINAVFRRVGEPDSEWSTAYTPHGIGPEGLPPGESISSVIALRSQLGYTGEQPRAEMLKHREFVDATVEVFAKHGPEQWVKLLQRTVERKVLTH